jgi:NADH:ubiquinone oxidoreductase subunit 5 (subunit L)/multisubunit Na+/H+ antiporter MnhA subunit
MAAPSPVSALLHAATMVTAGIYLMARMSLLLEMSEDALKIIAIVGGITAVYGGSIAIVQNDIKKVIAYSTCSQLGYMTMVCGLSGYNVAIYHLTNHAFFKALLFLGAGAIIHNMGDEQDVRRYGGLIRVMPVVYGTMLIGGLALMGFPYLAGYYSKDIILEIAYGKYTAVGFYCYILGVLAAICTSFYTIRLLTLTFGG